MNAHGKIFTFYSYKGGVGRTMAVANIGRLLASDYATPPAQTLLIDWDLEAPGLQRFFKQSRESERGLVDYFHALASLVANREDVCDGLRGDDRAAVLDEALPLAPYVVDTGVPGLFLMTAGASAKIASLEYQSKVVGLDWVGLFRQHGYAFDAFRELLSLRFAYTLIDSRTGIGDISGVCTAILPDRLVAMFAPNDQNMMVTKVVEAALEFRRLADEIRPLIVYPLASRCDPGDLVSLQRSLREFRDEFTSIFSRAYGLTNCDLGRYFEEVVLLYVPFYAYGERNAVDTKFANYPGSLRRSYGDFCRRLAEADLPWA
jgi:hypothetical protein